MNIIFARTESPFYYLSKAASNLGVWLLLNKVFGTRDRKESARRQSWCSGGSTVEQLVHESTDQIDHERSMIMIMSFIVSCSKSLLHNETHSFCGFVFERTTQAREFRGKCVTSSDVQKVSAQVVPSVRSASRGRSICGSANYFFCGRSSALVTLLVSSLTQHR